MNLLQKYNHPLFVLMGIVLLLPFAQVKSVFFGVPVYVPEMVLLGYITFCFFSPQLEKRRMPDKLFLLGAGLFLLGALVTFLVNPSSLRGLGMLKSWFFFPWLFGLFLFWEAQRHEERDLFLKSWYIVIGATALVNLILFFEGFVTYDHRLSGTYPSPNFLALFVAPALLLSVHFFFSKTKKSLFEKMLFFVGGAGAGVTVILTRSYGTELALLSALLVLLSGWFILAKKPQRFLIPILLFFVLLLGVVSFEHGSEKWQALSSLEQRSSLASRIMIWQAAWRIISDHPLFGIGVGRFQEEYLLYQTFFPPYLEWAVPEPHNLFFAVFLSTGLLGLFGFFLLVGRFIFLARVTFLYGEEQKKREALLFLSLLALFLVYGLTDTPYFKNDLAYIFVLTLSLGLASFGQEKTLQEEGF
jgi:O-antigen ligase